METNSKNIQRWMDDVKYGAIRLPRFQREEVWTPELVKKFLWAILAERPLGVFLVLDVDPNNQPFKTRPLAGSPDNGEPCRQHLLDGQQRLTALWRSFNDNHETHTFYVTFEESADGFTETDIKAVLKKGRDKEKIGNPIDEFNERWLPVKILTPGEKGAKQSFDWCKAVSDTDADIWQAISVFVQKLRERMTGTIIPYLPLSQRTSRDEAIEIFRETNSSSVNLSDYDFAVAQMENDTEASLRGLIDDLTEEVPLIEDLEGSNPVGDLVLKVQCVLEDKKPTGKNYRDLDFDALKENWDKIKNGIEWATLLLGNMRIWNSQRLPSSVPLRVLPALHQYIPESGHARAKAMRLVCKYLWWSFLTDRYDAQANDRLKEDFDALVDVLQIKKNEAELSMFKCEKPTKKDILEAGWPKGRRRLGRAILVASSLDGAKDIASNEELRQGRNVDHHHIFARAILKKICNYARSLNCMLLDPPSNKEWAKKWPGDFLMEAIRASGFTDDPEAEVKKRLKTHLVPGDYLITVKEKNGLDLATVYNEFLNKRATMVLPRIEKLLRDGER